MIEKRYIHELAGCNAAPLSVAHGTGGMRVHILALGDVGATLLLGLKILGAGIIDTIGIYDMNENAMERYEREMNQMGWAFEEWDTSEKSPEVVKLTQEQLFDCDMFLFCASKAIPAIGATGDVRMMQFDANRKIVEIYAKMAAEVSYKGIFAVVSDPVDPLCKAALLASGLEPGQIRGYGLGVMNRRAVYYAKKDPRLESYLTEGRAYGPHGSDLVIANSIDNYDDELSRQLTKKTVEANLEVRALGFKPYLAPAISSGAMSVIQTLRGDWNYSSVYLGEALKTDGDAFSGRGAFLGIRNRIKDGVVEYEDLPLPPELFERIKNAYDNLCNLI